MIYDEKLIKLLYFAMFCCFGVLSPYLPLFVEPLLGSKAEIGAILMLPYIGAFAFAPMWSILCDAYKAHGEVMMIGIIVSTIAFQVMNYLSTFVSLFAVCFIGSFFRAPIIPLLDSFVMSVLPDKTRYGDIRLWGAASFGLTSLLGGMMISDPVSVVSPSRPDAVPDPVNIQDHRHLYRPLFLVATISSIISGFIVLFLMNKGVLLSLQSTTDSVRSDPLTSNHHSKATNSKEIELVSSTASIEANSSADINSSEEEPDNPSKRPSQSVCGTILSALFFNDRGIDILIFATIVLCSGFGSGVIDVFLFVRLKQLGGDGLCMGLARIITCAAEIPMFMIAGKLQEKLGTWTLLTITQLAFALRFFYYSELISPWFVLPCEVLHGLTFAVTWSVSCSFANEVAPPGTNATMQSLLEGVHFGLGSGLGALVGGFVYDIFGPVRLFQGCSCLSLLSSSFALLKAIRESSATKPYHETSPHPSSKDFIPLSQQDKDANDEEMAL